MPGLRYHTVIFVETDSSGGGQIHHVTGDLVKGMEYQRRAGRRPEASDAFHSKELIGQVALQNYPHLVDQVCKSQPVQKAFNTRSSNYEPFKADGSFYEPDEPRQPLMKCT
ncbi:hypothetical protein EJ03DRAFT_265898 [Teratosphaeria nubilosa]|uniref:Uncharacterized protein n=1 Tax=Teratosphaeria nubilosa TaxID=161662 RepID=A0A6G1LK06_9PEZI|nr:hypothetical protein EJ03DRAFT_265898 [Teratosphaeria nubilosa]